ncbi:OmpA family protein [bacterium]|nr:OmpA family protein [bacterium]
MRRTSRLFFHIISLGLLAALSACATMNPFAELDTLRELKRKQDIYIQQQKTQLQQRNGEYLQLRQQSESRIAALENELKTAQAERQKALAERTRREETLQAANTQTQQRAEALASDLEYYQNQNETLTQTVADFQSELQQRQNAIAEQEKKVADLQASLESAKASLEKQQSDTKSVTAQLQEQKSKAASLEKDLQQAQKDLSEQKSGQDQTQGKLTAALEKAEVLKKEKEALQNQIASLQKTGGSSLPPAPTPVENRELHDAHTLLKSSFRPLADAGYAEVLRDERGLVIRLGVDYLFHPGSLTLDPAVLPTLDQIASVVNRSSSQYVEIQGHTDAQPLVNLPFEDNWGLAAERANKVLRYLVEDAGVLPGRIKSSSCSQYRPLKADASSLNRRVEVIISPEP